MFIRLLFFVEQTSSQFFIYKYQLAKKFNTTRISILKAPKWVTIDPVQERIYWIDLGDDNVLFINSTTFEGRNPEVSMFTHTNNNITRKCNLHEENNVYRKYHLVNQYLVVHHHLQSLII
jgi:DNA-binding beta-propeller fold protein YncE